MTAGALTAEQLRSAKRRGCAITLILAAVIVTLVLRKHYAWYWNHTEPSENELEKIAVLLNLKSAGQTHPQFQVSNFDYQYNPIGLDIMGSTAFSIRRTPTSPPWDDMLASWTRHDKLPSDISCIYYRPWFEQGLRNHSGPVYTRWMILGFAPGGEDEPILKPTVLSKLCLGYFSDPDIFNVNVEGEIMFANATFWPEETSVTRNWKRLPWDN